MLRIRKGHRGRLSKPFGRIYEGKGVNLVKKIEEIKKARYLATIGDLVSLYTLKAGYKPDIVIVDFKSERKELGNEFSKEITKYLEGYEIVRVRNPQGHISDELVEILIKILESKKRYCIIVDGEENLAALPLALLLPENSVILYGIPSKGIAAYSVKEKDKVLISHILEEMEEVGEDKVKKMLIGGDDNGVAD